MSKVDQAITKEIPTAFAKRIKRSKSYITKLREDERLVTEPKGKRWVILVEPSLALIEETKDPDRGDVADRHEAYRGSEKKETDQPPVLDQETINYQRSRAKK